MQVVKCILIEDCLAPKRVGNSVSKKAFRVGQTVFGTVTNIALTPDSQVLALKTKDGYVIPEPFLNIIGAVEDKKSRVKETSYSEEIQDAEVIDEGNDKTKSVSNVFEALKSSEIISRNSKSSKFIVNFALGGAVVGVVYAMMKNGNKLVFASIGAAVGGMAGNYVGNKIKENDKTE